MWVAGYAIPRHCRNMELAWDYIRFAVGPMGQQMQTQALDFLPVHRPTLERWGHVYADLPTFRPGGTLGLFGRLAEVGRLKPLSFWAYAKLGDHFYPVFNAVAKGQAPAAEAFAGVARKLEPVLAEARTGRQPREPAAPMAQVATC